MAANEQINYGFSIVEGNLEIRSVGYQYDARETGLACAFEMDDLSFRFGDRCRYLRESKHESTSMRVQAVSIIVLAIAGCSPVAQTEKKVAPQQLQASIGDAVFRATALEIKETRTFSRISSHFSDTPIADKPGFMYAGTDTAGIPVTEHSRTMFWLTGEGVTSAIALQPDKATLETQSGQAIACITDETIHMSCPGWVFPNWRVEHDRITGFLVFPRIRTVRGALRLPYTDQGKIGELVFLFDKED